MHYLQVASAIGGVKSRNMEKKQKALVKLAAGLRRFETDLSDTFFGGMFALIIDFC